jgi:hypothetical protein
MDVNWRMECLLKSEVTRDLVRRFAKDNPRLGRTSRAANMAQMNGNFNGPEAKG